jgi:hypothetical protein
MFHTDHNIEVYKTHKNVYGHTPVSIIILYLATVFERVFIPLFMSFYTTNIFSKSVYNTNSYIYIDTHTHTHICTISFAKEQLYSYVAYIPPQKLTNT